MEEPGPLPDLLCLVHTCWKRNISPFKKKVCTLLGWHASPCWLCSPLDHAFMSFRLDSHPPTNLGLLASCLKRSVLGSGVPPWVRQASNRRLACFMVGRLIRWSRASISSVWMVSHQEASKTSSFFKLGVPSPEQATRRLGGDGEGPLGFRPSLGEPGKRASQGHCWTFFNPASWVGASIHELICCKS